MGSYINRILLLLLLCMSICGCARKAYQSVERTASVVHDTMVVTKTDSVLVHDTLVVVSKMEIADSVVDRTETIIVVDSTGKVLSKSVYRDRGVYHNKDALSSSQHVTNRAQSKSDSQRSVAIKEERVSKAEERTLAKRKSLVTLISFAFVIALIVAIYRYIYYKGK